MKRLISIILTVVIICSISVTAGMTTSGADLKNASTGEGAAFFSYSVTDNEATITGYTGSAEILEIPSTLADYKVVGIGDGVFDDCTSLTNVIIPDGVTSIGEWAFGSCENLKSITIPDSVKSIGNSAFGYCMALESVTIPGSVRSIGINAFTCCINLSDVTISEGVTSIGGGAFSDCYSITSIKIPKSVTSLGSGAFSKCEKLTSITIPKGVTKIDDVTFYCCYELKSVTIPEGVKTINNFAFNLCTSLNSIIIPKSVTKIGKDSFGSCSNLNKVVIGNKDCEIYDIDSTFYEKATIYGHKNSTAYKYAQKYSRKFVELDADGHKWNKKVVKESSCKTDGSIVKTCEICGESKSEVIPAGHNTKTTGAKKATYFSKGCTGKKVCKICGKVVSKSKSVAKLTLKTPTVKYTGGKGTLKVSYTKVKDATGFEVKYTVGKKTVTKIFSSKKSVAKTIKKLKKGTYKVQVRAFVKSGSKTAYSGWTKAKSVKVK